jgi:tetratricopeptide (TPR) repeat protein
MGKSALLSHYIAHQSVDRPVVSHFCGATPQSTKLEGMVAYIATEMKRMFDIRLNIPKKIEDPGELFSAFLQAVPAQQSLLLVIDGLDQLADTLERRLTWLPNTLPQNIKLLLSTSLDEQKQILERKSFPVFELSPLDATNIQALTTSYLDIYSKKLPQQLLDEIGDFPQAGNPLVLFTLLNELRLFGRHEELQNHLSGYILTDSKAAFFETLLSRLQKDYPDKDFNLKGILTSLVLSVQGLTETEITEINQIPTLRWSQIYNVLDYHMLNKGGKLCINNPYLKKAVQKRYFDNNDSLKQHLEPLISHFYSRFKVHKQDWDSHELQRVLEELPQLALEAENSEVLLEVVTNFPSLALLYKNMDANIPRFFNFLRISCNLSQELKKSLEEFLIASPDDPQAITAAYISGVLVSSHISGAEAIPFLYKVLEVFNRQPVGNPYLFDALRELASIYTQLGYVNEAAEILMQLLPFSGKDDISEIFNLLPDYFRISGKSAIAGMLLQDTVEYSSHSFGKENILTAMQYNSMARHYDIIKDFERAGTWYEEAARIVEEQYGTQHALYLVIESNRGILQMSNGKPVEAALIFDKILQLRLSLFGENHRSTLKTINSLGVAKSLSGQFEEALQLLNRALKGQNRLLGPLHKETLITLSNLADAYERSGDKDKSIEILYDILEKLSKQYGEFHEQTINAAMGLAAALADAGKLKEAVLAYQRLLKMQKHFYGEEHQMVGLTAYKYASLRFASGEWDNEDVNTFVNWKMYLAASSKEHKDHEATRKHYLAVIDVIDRFAGGAHPAIFDAMENLAGLEHHLMKYQQAANWCERISGVARQVYGENHPAYLEFRVLQAFNLFSDGDRESSLELLRELSKYHEVLVDFPKKHVTSMYKELLGYYNAFGEAVERFNQNQDEVRLLYENYKKCMDQAVDRFENDAFPEAMHWIDKAIGYADILNEKFAEPNIGAFNHKASMQEQMELYDEAIATVKAGLAHIQHWNAILDPRSFFLLKLSGDAHLMLEQKAEALGFYEMAQKVNQHEADYPNENTIEINTSFVSYYVDNEDFGKVSGLIDETYPLALEKLGPDNTITKWLHDIKTQLSETD